MPKNTFKGDLKSRKSSLSRGRAALRGIEVVTIPLEEYADLLKTAKS